MEKAISLNTSIAPSNNMTRAIGDRWENGDAIGVYTDYANGGSLWFSNGKFVRKDNTSQFQSVTTYLYPTQDECAIKAYYPYDASVTRDSPNISFTCSGTATADGQKANDFLYATGKTTWGDTPTLLFNHKMTRVTFCIVPGDGFKGTLLNNKASQELLDGAFTFMGYTGGTFNTLTGVATPGTWSTISLSGSENTSSSDDYCLQYELILPPQSTDNIEFQYYNSQTGISLTSCLDSESKYRTWDAGCSYTYYVVINKESLSVLSSNIKYWDTIEYETITPTM